MPMDLQLLIDTQSMVYYCLYSGCLWEVGLSVITHPSLCPWRFPHQFPGVPCLHWAQAAVLSFWWPTSAERIHGFFDAQLLPSDCQGGVLQLDGRRKIQPMWAYPMMNIVKPSPRIFHALFKCFLLINQPSWRFIEFIALDLPLLGNPSLKPLSSRGTQQWMRCNTTRTVHSGAHLEQKLATIQGIKEEAGPELQKWSMFSEVSWNWGYRVPLYKSFFLDWDFPLWSNHCGDPTVMETPS